MTAPDTPGWPNLRRATPARIGLRRTGTAIATTHHLEFQLAHARARDAVYAALDVPGIVAGLAEIGLAALPLHSAATDRPTYLRRPDLGRRLDENSRQMLTTTAPPSGEILFVIADGLSATAVNAHAVPLIRAVLAQSEAVMPPAGPVAIVEGGRVALGDEIGGLLGVSLVAVLIGERPGLSAADSLGVYVTWQPAPGTPDAARNCLSNIRPQGMSIAEAAAALLRLFAAARRHRMTGVALSRHLAENSVGHLSSSSQ